MKFQPGDRAVYQGTTGRVTHINSETNTLIFQVDNEEESKELSMDDVDITILTRYWSDDLDWQNTFFKTLIGKSFRYFTTTGDTLRLGLNEVEYFDLIHIQNCCEDVYIESIEGNLKDLLDSPLTMAEVASNIDDEKGDTEQWTFYKFATVKGYVTIRFYGTSNGYYSTGVDLLSNIKNEVSDEI